MELTTMYTTLQLTSNRPSICGVANDGRRQRRGGGGGGGGYRFADAAIPASRGGGGTSERCGPLVVPSQHSLHSLSQLPSHRSKPWAPAKNEDGIGRWLRKHRRTEAAAGRTGAGAERCGSLCEYRPIPPSGLLKSYAEERATCHGYAQLLACAFAAS